VNAILLPLCWVYFYPLGIEAMTDAQSNPQSDPQPNPLLDPVRLPILKMAAMSVVACVVIGFAGGWIATTKGLAMSDGAWSIGAVLPGIILTLMTLNMLPARSAGLWAVPVLAGTMIRAGLVIVIGFGIFLTFGPSKNIFLMTLLMSVLAVLVIDVMTVLSLVKTVTEKSVVDNSVEHASVMNAPEVQA